MALKFAVRFVLATVGSNFLPPAETQAEVFSSDWLPQIDCVTPAHSGQAFSFRASNASGPKSKGSV